MPHLIEKYALETGLRIDKMKTYEQFFPLPANIDKYILISSGSGMAAKNYSYFNDVVWLLKDALHEKGFKIIQVGGKDDERLNSDLDLCGATSTNQLFYLVQKASLVLSNDTSVMHLAGHYDVPFVALFGLTDPRISGAYFGNPLRQKYLIPDYGSNSPSFNPNEKPKVIDSIRPEDVANAVGELLGFEPTKILTLFVGDQYRFQAIEVIPNHIVDVKAFPQSVLNLRLDFGGEDAAAFANIQNRKCNLVTNHPVDVNVLIQLRANIGNIVYEITDDHNPNFVRAIQRAGIPYILFTHFSAEKLQEVKMDYFDYGLIHKKPIKKREDIPNHELIVEGQTGFRSNKFLLSKGKIYLSRAHWKEDIAVTSFESNHSYIIDTEEFWKESDFFYLYNKLPLTS